LDFTGGASLNFINGATLDNVTPDNDLTLGDNAAVDITNGLNLGSHTVYLQGNHSAITFDGTQTLASGTIQMTGTNDTVGIVATSTLTLGPAATIVGGDGAQIGVSAGEGLSTTALVNQGTIT